MTVATVKSVAKRFLTTDTPEVLALKGAWGVGKTYAWKQLVEQIKDHAGLQSYCYVSLFGVSSLSELRTAIVAKTRPIKQVGAKRDVATINKEWALRAQGTLRSILSLVAKAKDAPLVKNLSVGIDAIAPYLINKTIICLDDFERLNDASIKADELLGFISSLKEERACKIVLIFNEDELSTKADAYERYREKIVDIELLFAPSAEEAADLAFPPDFPFREQAKRYSTSLDIRNIRILRRIVSVIELIHKELNSFHEGVMQQAIMTTVLLTWSRYSTSPETPSMDFIRNWNRVLWNTKGDDETEAGLRRVEWTTAIHDYGLTHMDEFDYAISKVIERGYTEETGLSIEAAKLDVKFRENELRGSFSAAWALFHNTFADNEKQLVEALESSFRRSVHTIDAVTLNGTVRLLRNLDRDGLASQLIDFYIQERQGEENLFDLDEYPFSGDINDQELRNRFREQFTAVQNRKLPPLLDAVNEISKNHGWSKKEIAVLEQATEEDYYNLFNRDHGDNLGNIVRTCLRFEGLSGHEAIGAKVRAALVRIGRESQLNAIRVRRYGIDIK